jgi:hypothetical protein
VRASSLCVMLPWPDGATYGSFTGDVAGALPSLNGLAPPSPRCKNNSTGGRPGYLGCGLGTFTVRTLPYAPLAPQKGWEFALPCWPGSDSFGLGMHDRPLYALVGRWWSLVDARLPLPTNTLGPLCDDPRRKRALLRTQTSEGHRN